MNVLFPERRCAYCGRVFYPVYAHAFRISERYFCKYTCMLRWREARDAKRTYRSRGLGADGSKRESGK